MTEDPIPAWPLTVNKVRRADLDGHKACPFIGVVSAGFIDVYLFEGTAGVVARREGWLPPGGGGGGHCLFEGR